MFCNLRGEQYQFINMTNLKTNLLLLCCLLLGASFSDLHAQGERYQLKDSVHVRDRNNMRQWYFENDMSAFPAPRKDRWSIGIQGGTSFISGDVDPKLGLGMGFNVRKSLGHTFSLRAQGSFGYAKGQNWRRNGGYAKNDAFNGRNDSLVDYTQPGTYTYVFYNHRTSYFDLNLQGVLNLGNISFYKRDPKVGIFAFGGLGGFFYRTMVDARDDNGIYDFSGVPTDGTPDIRQDALNSLRNLQDGEYETEAESHSSKSTVFNRTMAPSAMLGLGIQFKLSERVDLALEHRVTWTGDDLVDGQRWEETLTLTANSDYHQYSTIGFNFRIGDAHESRWFANPLEGPMGDIRTLKSYHSKASKDSDNDGVPDAQDKEPGTPEGAMVDVRGRAVDSDGDGLQDFRDKEPFSPKGAQVDRYGVALDSDKDGVPDVYDQEINSPEGAQVDANGKSIAVQGNSAAITNEDADLLLPMINFDLGKAEIKQEFYPSLYYIARMMMERENLRLQVIGHTDNRGGDDKNKKLAEQRAQNVVDFLSQNFKIDKSRFEIKSLGESEPLIEGLPDKRNQSKEGFYYLNRRVEFLIVE